MVDRQKRDTEWEVADAGGTVPTWECAGIAVLMDIRRELRRLNGTLNCTNFLNIPHTLNRISANTAKPKKRKKVDKHG